MYRFPVIFAKNVFFILDYRFTSISQNTFTFLYAYFLLVYNENIYICPMSFYENTTIRIAILDLNAGAENQGMRCIREIINQYGEYHHLHIISTEYDVRNKIELPGTDHDIYISSGGPGSPVESIGAEWDNQYMDWLEMMHDF